MSALLIAIGLLVQALTAPVAGPPRAASDVVMAAPGTPSAARMVAVGPESLEHETEAGAFLAVTPEPGRGPVEASGPSLAVPTIIATAGSDRLDRPPKRG